MTNEVSFISADNLDHDPYTRSQTRERTLNAAIIRANITESFEEYLEIFDEFYADEIEVSSETGEEPIRLLVSVRQTAIPGDAADETHSAWTLKLVGVSGRSCTVSWRALRKWSGSRVVCEYHYDHQQSGGPLTSNDLSLYAATSATADGRFS